MALRLERVMILVILNTAETVKKITPVEIPAPETLATDRNAFLAAVTSIPQPVAEHGPFVHLKNLFVHSVFWQTFNLQLIGKDQRKMTASLSSQAKIKSVQQQYRSKATTGTRLRQAILCGIFPDASIPLPKKSESGII